MALVITTCRASTIDGIPCDHPVIAKSSHCQIHHARAVKLYRRYKRTSDELNRLDIDKILREKDLKKIFHLYSVVQKDYLGRINHRLYAFAREYHDSGHTYRLTYLSQLLQRIEKVLEEYFEQEVPTQSSDSSSESDDESDDESDEIEGSPPENIKKKVNEYRSQRSNLERDTEQCLKMYKEINLDRYNSLKHEKILLEVKLFQYVDKLTPEVKAMKDCEPERLGVWVICLSNIVLQMTDLGVFKGNNDDYKMKKGNLFRPYQFKDGVFFRFSDLYTFEIMKDIYSKLLLHWKIIKTPYLQLLKWMCQFKTMDALSYRYRIAWVNEYNKVCLIRFDCSQNTPINF